MMGLGNGDMYPGSLIVMLGVIAMFILLVMMPARTLQKRHGYPAWLLAFGLVPYIGPLCLLWAFALTTPKLVGEAA